MDDIRQHDQLNWDEPELRVLVRAAIEEDVGEGDVTTAAIVGQGVRARARILAKQDVILAGLPVVERVFRQLDPHVRFSARFQDGVRVAAGLAVAEIDGSARAILTGERTALNFLAHLTGIATLTGRYVAALAGTATRLRDTRKTTPLFRRLEKYAVRMGGGVNHRFGLADGVLIKENHIAAAGGVMPAIQRVREAAGHGLAVEVEVRNGAELYQALAAGPDEILLDNLPPSEAVRLVKIARQQRPGCRIELSGRIMLENLREYAGAGADFVSVGELTHSPRAADFSLLVEWAGVE